jgi:hypothetical protein
MRAVVAVVLHLLLLLVSFASAVSRNLMAGLQRA